MYVIYRSDKKEYYHGKEAFSNKIVFDKSISRAHRCRNSKEANFIINNKILSIDKTINKNDIKIRKI